MSNKKVSENQPNSFEFSKHNFLVVPFILTVAFWVLTCHLVLVLRLEWLTLFPD